MSVLMTILSFISYLRECFHQLFAIRNSILIGLPINVFFIYGSLAFCVSGIYTLNYIKGMKNDYAVVSGILIQYKWINNNVTYSTATIFIGS